jgi:hypothetical protein
MLSVLSVASCSISQGSRSPVCESCCRVVASKDPLNAYPRDFTISEIWRKPINFTIALIFQNIFQFKDVFMQLWGSFMVPLENDSSPSPWHPQPISHKRSDPAHTPQPHAPWYFTSYRGCGCTGIPFIPNSTTKAFSYGFSSRPCPSSFRTSRAHPTTSYASSLRINSRRFELIRG